MSAPTGPLIRTAGAVRNGSKAGPGAGVLLCSLLLLVVGLAIFWPSAIDDAYISARYAHNLAGGAGPVFNVGEHVEGYSHPLWLVPLTIGELLGVGAIPVAKISGVAAGLGLVGFVWWTLREEGLGRWSGAPLIVLALQPSLAVWSVSGLETTAYALAAVSGTVMAGRHARGVGRGLVSGVLLGCAALLRPEGIAYLAVVPLAHASSRSMSRVSTPLLAAAAVVAPYLFFRFAFFGQILPNTYYAKSGGSLLHLVAGSTHLLAGLTAGGLFIVGAAIVGVWAHRTNPVVVGGFFGGVVAMGFVVWAGGDWMPAHRFILPAMSLLVVPAGAGMSWLVEHRTTATRRLVGGVALLACAAAAWGHVVIHREFGTSLMPESEVRKDLGEWLAQVPPGEVVAAGDMGETPYAAPSVRFLDWYGLVDDEIALMRHEGASHVDVSRYVLAQNPAVVVLVVDRHGDLEARYGQGLREDPEFEKRYRHVMSLEDFAPGSNVGFPDGRYFAVYGRRNLDMGPPLPNAAAQPL